LPLTVLAKALKTCCHCLPLPCPHPLLRGTGQTAAFRTALPAASFLASRPKQRTATAHSFRCLLLLPYIPWASLIKHAFFRKGNGLKMPFVHCVESSISSWRPIIIEPNTFLFFCPVLLAPNVFDNQL
jgi:hypothetical protein